MTEPNLIDFYMIKCAPEINKAAWARVLSHFNNQNKEDKG